jgi:hypothetical protein
MKIKPTVHQTYSEKMVTLGILIFNFLIGETVGGFLGSIFQKRKEGGVKRYQET